MATKLNSADQEYGIESKSAKQIISQCSSLVHEMMKMPVRSMWIDYDVEADVMYISFKKPQRASKTIEYSDDILIRKSGRTIVGVTIMNASTHA